MCTHFPAVPLSLVQPGISLVQPGISPPDAHVHHFVAVLLSQGYSQHHDWNENKYFMSSQETAFDLQLLVRFDVQLLIGQTSYKQTAEIYNIIHGYDDTKKSCTHVHDSGSSSDEDK